MDKAKFQRLVEIERRKAEQIRVQAARLALQDHMSKAIGRICAEQKQFQR